MRHFLVKAAHLAGVDTRPQKGSRKLSLETELVRIYTTHISLSMFPTFIRSRADSGSVGANLSLSQVASDMDPQTSL